ncbi:unnamed protein product [Ectocarpus fasciculatus]
MYGNNRTNSFVEDGKLFLQPTLTSDYMGEEQVSGVFPTTFDMWGLVPADQCTSNMFYGCSRASNLASRIAINPVMSARVRTAGTFSFRYGRMEVKAKLPKGDWCEGRSECCGRRSGFSPSKTHTGSGRRPGKSTSWYVSTPESRGNSASYGSGVEGIGGVNSASSAFHWGPHYR